MVSYVVTKDVVDHLEIFDVEVGDGIGCFFLGRNFVLDPVEQVFLGEQSRELVVGGFVNFLFVLEDFFCIVLNA